MATEVYNWVQKYDADLDGRQVRDHSTVKTHLETKKKKTHTHTKKKTSQVQCDLVKIST